MQRTQEFEIKSYHDTKNNDHFSKWFLKLDLKTQDIILMRLNRIKSGNFGDCKSVGDKIYEIRIHINSGYRIYFIKEKQQLIILLCAGNKASQAKDIKNAKDLARQYYNNL